MYTLQEILKPAMLLRPRSTSALEGYKAGTVNLATCILLHKKMTNKDNYHLLCILRPHSRAN